MALVNHTIPGLFGGVSQQDPSLRHATQVTEMINCYPTVIGGVTKRPPTQLAYVDTTFPEDSFIYSYDRGTGNEQYVICINSNSQYRIFDLVKNEWVNSWTTESYLAIPEGSTAKDSFSLTTVGDTTFVVNKTISCAMEYNAATVDTTTYIFNAGYSLKSESFDVFSTTYYGISGTLTCTISIDIEGVTHTHSASEDVAEGGLANKTKTPFYSSFSFSNLAKQTLSNFAYEDIETPENSVYVYGNSIQSEQELTNPTMSITFSGTYGTLSGSSSVAEGGEDLEWEQSFYYWVKRTNGDATDNASLRYSYYIYNDIGATIGTVVSHNSTQAATDLASDIGGMAIGSVVKKIVPIGEKYTGADSWGNQASEAWQGKVKKLQDLPTSLGFEGAVIEITGDEDTGFDNYYVKYTSGVFKETVKPGMSNYLKASSMPHKLEIRRLTDDPTYYVNFRPIEWNNRKVGDENSASEPSFIGQTIQDVFFYRNRLGFITGDNVVLSESGEYYNFWPTTVTSVLDSDPIDVAVDSNQAISLKYAVPFNKELLIFGNKAQFVMSSGDTLTPKDVSVQQSTAFEIKEVPPVVLGPNAYFATEKNNYSGIREYYVQPDSLSNDAADITAHCPNYIPKNLIKLTGSSKNDMLFALSSEMPNTVFVYNFYWNGEEKAQSAWHKWQFAGSVFNIEVLGSNLLLMINRSGNIALEVVPLEYVLDFTNVTYNDNGTTPFESSITITKPGFPTGKDKIDDNRGTFILRSFKFNADYGSIYNITSNRFNKPRTYNYVEGVGQLPAKSYIASKEYNYRLIGGIYPDTYVVPNENLLPGGETYIMDSDHKYPILGNVDNLEVVVSNNIPAGFRINALDVVGTYVKNPRNV